MLEAIFLQLKHVKGKREMSPKEVNNKLDDRSQRTTGSTIWRCILIAYDSRSGLDHSPLSTFPLASKTSLNLTSLLRCICLALNQNSNVPEESIRQSQRAFQIWPRAHTRAIPRQRSVNISGTRYIPHRRSVNISGISRAKSAFSFRSENNRSEKQKPLPQDLTSTDHAAQQIASKRSPASRAIVAFTCSWVLSSYFSFLELGSSRRNTDMVSGVMAHRSWQYMHLKNNSTMWYAKPAIWAHEWTERKHILSQDSSCLYEKIPESDSMIPPMPDAPDEQQANMMPV